MMRYHHGIDLALLILLLAVLLATKPQPAQCWNLKLFSRRNNRKSATRVDAAPTPPSSVASSSGGAAAGTATPGHAGTGTGEAHRRSGGTPLFADLVGDFDLSSIPQWFRSEVIPRLPPLLTDTIPKTLMELWTSLKAMILYKPPVGIAAFYLTFRLLFRNQRTLSQMGLSDIQIREEEALGGLGKGRKWKRRAKALDLDMCDREYDTYGGVENVRGELCTRALEGVDASSAACAGMATKMSGGAQQRRENRPGVTRIGGSLRQSLSGAVAGAGQRIRKRLVPSPLELDDDIDSRARTMLADDTATSGSDDEAKASTIPPPLAEAASIAMDSLSVSCPPRGSRELYVLKSSESLSVLSMAIAAYNSSTGSKSNGKSSEETRKEILDLVEMACSVVTVRTLDAMLRVTRDRLVTSSNRLRRARSNWDWAVRVYSGGPIRRAFSKAFRTVLRWIGRGSLEDDRRYLGMAEAAYVREVTRLGRVQELLLSRPNELKGASLLGALESGGISKDVYGGGVVKPKGAQEVLLGEIMSSNEEKSWSKEVKRWTLDARAFVREVTADVFQTVDSDKKCMPGVTVDGALELVERWSEGQRDDDIDAWRAVLCLVERLATPRRVGEHRARVRISDVVQMIKRLDFGGVPSTVFFIWLAHIVHDAVKPHWKSIVDFGQKAGVAVWGVIDMRFWRPLRDITLDLLNRRPHLVDPYALSIEESSLDNMLRDLGIGDGTPGGRAAAVAAAARLYEDELKSGALRGLVRGRVVRLMLIQIQQLKAGLLKAMGSIDDLVDKNRLNVQLLASIPAFILITYGSKLLASFIVGLRMKRVTPLPMRNLQEEMSDCLRRIERCLLLSGRDDDLHDSETDGLESEDEGGKRSATSKELKDDLDMPDAIRSAKYEAPQLSSDELGEFILLCHSYLLLLDYATPPISYRTFDAVHRDMQELLLQGQLSVSRQLQLLGLITKKNAELLKNV